MSSRSPLCQLLADSNGDIDDDRTSRWVHENDITAVSPITSKDFSFVTARESPGTTRQEPEPEPEAQNLYTPAEDLYPFFSSADQVQTGDHDDVEGKTQAEDVNAEATTMSTMSYDDDFGDNVDVDNLVDARHLEHAEAEIQLLRDEVAALHQRVCACQSGLCDSALYANETLRNLALQSQAFADQVFLGNHSVGAHTLAYQAVANQTLGLHALGDGTLTLDQAFRHQVIGQTCGNQPFGNQAPGNNGQTPETPEDGFFLDPLEHGASWNEPLDEEDMADLMFDEMFFEDMYN